MQEPDLIRSLRFQFHKGTIRTFYLFALRFLCRLFQFHKGTIRTPLRVTPRLYLANFNSIKVQLEPSIPMKNTSLCFLFQFHKGTIRTFFFCMNAFPKQLFQFHKGTIRTGMIGLMNFGLKISIP